MSNMIQIDCIFLPVILLGSGRHSCRIGIDYSNPQSICFITVNLVQNIRVEFLVWDAAWINLDPKM